MYSLGGYLINTGQCLVNLTINESSKRKRHRLQTINDLLERAFICYLFVELIERISSYGKFQIIAKHCIH